jgi:hypothetical protein
VADSQSKAEIGWSEIPALATVLGVITYGFLRLAYGSFYRPLGVTPEEVGLGFNEVLTRSILFMVLVVGFAAVALIIFVAGSVVWRRAFHRTHAPRSLPRRTIHLVFIVALVVAALSFEFALVGAARESAEAVKEGRSVGPVRLLWLPLLRFQAEPADVSWLGQSQPPTALAERTCIHFLGAANGTLVLYDTRADQVLRLPQDQILVAANRTDDTGCAERRSQFSQGAASRSARS